MSSLTIITLFAVLLTLFPSSSVTSASDFFGPILSPIANDICNEVGCGKGKCKMSGNDSFGLKHVCECDPGWKQTVFSNITGLEFLPCVIPNCTLNHSCSEAAAPAPALAQDVASNATDFEPCHLMSCGGGVCHKKSVFTYVCECKEGYSNLLNNTAFPCFKECSFGGDCSNLGFSMPNASTASAPPPSLADHSGSNQARSRQPEALFHGMAVLAMSIAPLLYVF